MVTCNFNNTITERDMDLLLAEVIATDNDFCRMIVDKTDLKGMSFEITQVEVSKADNDGESDITIVINAEGRKCGLLIEDKINAPAMQDQHGRYHKRGEKGIKYGDYETYRVFVFCPEKYRESNSEAKKYEYLLTYEETRDYFKKKDDPLSAYRVQQLSQALKKAKRSPSPAVDPESNAFLRKYIQYQREHYPMLDLSTKEDKNGKWADYRTNLGCVYIYHKIEEGYVDLTFPKAEDKVDRVKAMADWARYHGIPDATVPKPKKGAKSAMIRIRVPKIIIKNGFDAVDKQTLDSCFETIKELSDFAAVIEIGNSVVMR